MNTETLVLILLGMHKKHKADDVPFTLGKLNL